MPLALVALALSAFAIGTTEFLTNGLLSPLAADFDISVADAGLVTTAYAVGQMCGPLLALATLRLPMKKVLVILMVIFTVGNLVAAFSPTFTFLLASRFATAWSHTAFFGVASVAASRMVPAGRQAAAIAVVFTGLSLANVLGMPLGTLTGQVWGWRGAFLVVTVVSAVSLAGISALVPTGHDSAISTDLRSSLRPFANPRLWSALAATAIGFGGLFASFTYIEPLLTTVTGFSATDVVWLLVIYGAGLVVGNWLAGRAADRALHATVVTLLLLLAAALAVLAFTASSRAVTIPMLFVLGACGFGLLTPLQTFVLRFAGSGSVLVGTANTAAFGAGITLGSLLGAAVLNNGGGFIAVNLFAGAMTLLGLAVYAVTVLMGRGSGTTAAHMPSAATGR
ncbi:MFS transporter [Streptomyces sp. NPDC032161]|uniref:MFS transporter n=1 Tax=unclassified Streptomyces TaxID=2593676 RepID=UPI0033E5283D